MRRTEIDEAISMPPEDGDTVIIMFNRRVVDA